MKIVELCYVSCALSFKQRKREKGHLNARDVLCLPDLHKARGEKGGLLARDSPLLVLPMIPFRRASRN